MSLANPDQLAKLIDEDYEIRSHEEESSEGQHKVEEEESSEEQHKGGGGGGGGGEDEDEDEDEDEEFGVCEVCLKDNEHDTFDCPYLDRIPNLEEATIGDGYAIVCRECHVLGGHRNWGWVGRAVMKFCNFCQRPGVHWDSECPKNPDPKVYDVASQCKLLMWEVYGGI